MKIVFASTAGQDEEIGDLIEYFFSGVMPRYFSDREIKDYERLGVLHKESCQDAFGTLRDAFYVMTSLQTLISILDSPVPGDHHRALFMKNVENLRFYGFYFPFQYDSFLPGKKCNDSIFSVFTPAANQLLV
ncbi:DUF5365 family protein [Bacillus sp. FJAT-27445]|uniref:DUF5365 family protein n=1 Tax=Bacillus sp. FJAT-27445 TaxID=1679166 RepID=UPI000B011E1A|nr:DUF5365 family protein [Bacillus sp. FJAT-27445]